MALLKTCFLLAFTCGLRCMAIQLKRNMTSSQSEGEFRVLKLSEKAVPVLSQKGATCRAEHQHPVLYGILSPEECASKVLQRTSCGPYFTFAPSYPGWGCRCCENGGAYSEPHKYWNVYSAVPHSPKKMPTDRAKTAVPLRLAQWNVAGFNPGCANPKIGGEDCKLGCPVCAKESLELTKTIEQKLLAVKTKFDDNLPDVITLNEDIEFDTTSSNNSLRLGSDYVFAGSCRAEALWDTEPAYENGGRFLQNSMWIRRSAWQIARTGIEVISSDSNNEYPRCTIVTTLTSGSKKVIVASAHLTGGRFVDQESAAFAGNKSYEVRQTLNYSHRVMGQFPDVVIGDLNSYWNASDVIAHQQSYEPFINATEANRLDAYFSWAMEGVKALNDRGYERLPIDQSTTKYGGVVDHMFVNMSSGIKTGSPASVGVVDDEFKTSDHAIIYAEIEVP